MPNTQRRHASDHELLRALKDGALDATAAGLWTGNDLRLERKYLAEYRRMALKGWVALRAGADTPSYGADLKSLSRGPVEASITITALGRHELETLDAFAETEEKRKVANG